MRGDWKLLGRQSQFSQESPATMTLVSTSISLGTAHWPTLAPRVTPGKLLLEPWRGWIAVATRKAYRRRVGPMRFPDSHRMGQWLRFTAMTKIATCGCGISRVALSRGLQLIASWTGPLFGNLMGVVCISVPRRLMLSHPG